jgi:hypothetical protein
LTIKLLISELSTIKNALGRIHDWAEYNLTESQARKLGDGLDTTLDGCKVAMEVLAEDVADLVGADSMDHGRVRTYCVSLEASAFNDNHVIALLRIIILTIDAYSAWLP